MSAIEVMACGFEPHGEINAEFKRLMADVLSAAALEIVSLRSTT